MPLSTLPPPATNHLHSHRFDALQPGPRLIVTGAVHGNETCGTQAIRRLLAEIESDRLHLARGTLTLVPVCNPLAYARGQRAGDRNLNRGLRPQATPQAYEDHIANHLCPLLAAHEVLLDLHSFRNPGQPFVLRGPADNSGPLEPFAHAADEARLVAHLGPTRVVDGWMASYAQGVARRQARARAAGREADALAEDSGYGIGTTEYMRSQGGWGVTLECGQHDDPQAPEVAYRAIRQTLALLGLVDEAPAPPAAAFECLSLVDVVDRLHEGDQFVQTWASFDRLQAGQTIATRHDGTPVTAPHDGHIVFPDPAARPGHEWFYLARASDRPLP
jgi:predicted deacylase